VPATQTAQFIDVPVRLVDEHLVDMLEVPAGHMPPLHVHHGHDELFYVIAGDVTFLLPGDEIRAGAGDVVRAPKGVPHVYRVEGDEPARWLCWSEPRGFEQFVAEVSAHDDPQPQQLAEIGARHGIEILGPPGALPA
jgi:quercetin dioxygenase-like cupin family protein